ncbi:hypothetical protein GCM10010286_57800 [Streptomyces toxytricini]|nr:hypothetical protein GCM10010286_57800 [Streptomyces toxytricini]
MRRPGADVTRPAYHETAGPLPGRVWPRPGGSGISAGRGARLGGSTGCTAAFATGREGAMSAYRTAAADGRSTRVPRGTRPSAHGTRYSGY